MYIGRTYLCQPFQALGRAGPNGSTVAAHDRARLAIERTSGIGPGDAGRLTAEPAEAGAETGPLDSRIAQHVLRDYRALNLARALAYLTELGVA